MRRIFERATSAPFDGGRVPAPQDGLTLAELQAIGEEVGLSATHVADAASALGAPAPAAGRRTVLGMPVSVTRTTSLPRLPTDREWELLLVELRATFGVPGLDGSKGNLREWRHGFHFAYLEPTDAGAQLRIGTTKADAHLLNLFGGASLIGGAITLVTLLANNDLAGVNALLPVICGAVAAAAFGSNALRLPGWARMREAQMEHVGERARALVSRTEPAADP